MPSKFWSKSSASHTPQSQPQPPSQPQPQPTPEPPANHSRAPSQQSSSYHLNQSTANTSTSDVRYSLSTAHGSAQDLDSGSAAGLAGRAYPDSHSPSDAYYADQQYQPHAHSSDPGQNVHPNAPSRSAASRKTIKSRLLAVAAAAREEGQTTQHEPQPQKEHSRGFFGRKRSVRKADAPIVRLTADEPGKGAKWAAEHTTAPAFYQQDRFEPYSPDFTPDQLGHHKDLPERPIQQTEALDEHLQHPPRSYPTHLSSGAGTSTPPARASFDSLQRPHSTTGTTSRPISQQSYEHRGPVQTYRDDHTEGHWPARGQGQYAHTSPTSATSDKQDHLEQSIQPLRTSSLEPAEMYRGNPDQSRSRDANRSNAEPTAGPSTSMSNLAPKLSHQYRDTEMGRSTPPPVRSASDLTEAEVNQLVEAHRELLLEHNDMKKKYNNVKRQYFSQKEQVDSLQNAIANQRITQSRTHLDDGEYIKRMSRLDGLVAQLAFSIRKDWQTIPDWLVSSVNKDAIQVGKQEMTAVGRAIISSWLVDELFNYYFHPDLPIDLSIELKAIQRRLRDQFVPQTIEDEDSLSSRISNWRLTTIDGLRPVLGSQGDNSNRKIFIESMTAKLVHACAQYMREPPPPDLEGGAFMIVELASTVLANLPQESRDVQIEYFRPGQLFDDKLMRLEAGVPNLAIDHDRDPDNASIDSRNDRAEIDSVKSTEEGRKGFLGGLMGKKNQTKSEAPQAGPPPTSAERDDKVKVRFCTFLALQIRGRAVLVTAPVYRL